MVGKMRKLPVFLLPWIAVCSSVIPASAFPSLNPAAIQVADVHLVQYWRHHGRSWGGHGNYGRGYYGGYRPYGGYRYGGYGGYYGRGYYGSYYGGYNDFGLLLGGLATGAIIGGALAQPYYSQREYYEEPRYYGNSHTSWCYSRYRSYRAYDNTFQPYYGPRRQCIGPY